MHPYSLPVPGLRGTFFFFSDTVRAPFMRIIESFCPQPTKQALIKKLNAELPPLKVNKSGPTWYVDREDHSGN